MFACAALTSIAVDHPLWWQGCLRDFLASSHYSYINELRLKEATYLSVGYFQVTRMLGEGGFGLVLEVVKRDCGRRYAMKVRRQTKIDISMAYWWPLAPRSTLDGPLVGR